MTVGQLIDELQRHPRDAEVLVPSGRKLRGRDTYDFIRTVQTRDLPTSHVGQHLKRFIVLEH